MSERGGQQFFCAFLFKACAVAWTAAVLYLSRCAVCGWDGELSWTAFLSSNLERRATCIGLFLFIFLSPPERCLLCSSMQPFSAFEPLDGSVACADFARM